MRPSAVAVVPGGGTYAMEAVARQFATGKRALIVRNGWFSLSLDPDLRDGRVCRRDARW